MAVESFLFRLDKYKGDQGVEALQEVFGLPGKYALLELWGYVMRSDKWPLFKARIHLAAFRRTLCLDDDGTDIGIIRMLDDLKPGVIEFHGTNIFTFHYPRLYNFLGRYGQRKACEFFGLILKDSDIPKDSDDYWELLENSGNLREVLEKFGKVSLGQVSLGVGVGSGGDKRKRSDLKKNTSKKAASSSNPGSPPLFFEILAKSWERQIKKNTNGKLETEIFTALLGDGWEFDALQAQIDALADRRNWWAGKIKRASTFARKLGEGIDFVARLDEEIQKNGGKAQKTDDHEAERQARKGQDGAFGRQGV